ncbi:MAG TPA: hypothetical protein VIT90_02280 [Lysobacter sp.]
MSAKGIAITAGLLGAVIAAPMPARADVFKCTVGGQAVYQDKPCAGGGDGKPLQRTARSETAGGVSVPQPIERSPAPGASSLTTLHQQIRDADSHSRDLQTAYEADVRATRARVAGLPMDQQTREAEALKAKWQPQIRQADERSRELRDQLRRECPGGAILNDRSQTCSR